MHCACWPRPLAKGRGLTFGTTNPEAICNSSYRVLARSRQFHNYQLVKVVVKYMKTQNTSAKCSDRLQHYVYFTNKRVFLPTSDSYLDSNSPIHWLPRNASTKQCQLAQSAMGFVTHFEFAWNAAEPLGGLLLRGKGAYRMDEIIWPISELRHRSEGGTMEDCSWDHSLLVIF